MSEKLNIVVFPWLAFGHMLPFLELSKHLAKRGHTITFVSAPRNLNRLPEQSLIQFAPLPLPQVEGLPTDASATSDVAPEQVQYLKKAFDLLQEPFSLLVNEKNPDWIIHDFAHHWIAGSTVPCVFFSVFNAAALRFYGSPWTLRRKREVEEVTKVPEWITFPSKVAYRRHEAEWLMEAYTKNASGVSDCYRMAVAIESCKAVAPRSCRELELDYLSLIQDLYQKPVIPVGLLPAPSPSQIDNREHNQIINWLDYQAPKSVIYVALGSEATLSNEYVHELALGLELSRLPFIWALCKGIEALPEGFKDRMKDRGLVAGWVPQIEVLGHRSVGGFLTHCGMSSVVEGFQFGLPLVMLPIFVDQGLNARVIEEKGVGVEVARDEEDGSFSKEAVAAAARLVMVEDEGEGFRHKAKEMIEVFEDEGCHEKYMDEFSKYLIDNKL